MENLPARSICYFSDMPVSFSVHVKRSGRADIAVLETEAIHGDQGKTGKGKIHYCEI